MAANETFLCCLTDLIHPCTVMSVVHAGARDTRALIVAGRPEKRGGDHFIELEI